MINSYHNYLNIKKSEKNYLSNREEFFSQNIVLVKKIIIGTIFVLTLLGFLIYLGMKKVEYQGKFKLVSFIFGTKVCKNNSMGKNIDSNISQNKLNAQSIIYFIKKAFS